MTKRVFISYSHKDESFRNDLEDHLSMLRRNEVISVWHDRKILAGEEWKGKIDENLDSADIVLFLISSSFLASDYCYDIEVKQAMENRLAGKCQIISIIIRPCDWNSCDFASLQAVPKDGMPISKWDDNDDAWLDAVNGIKKHIEEFEPVQQIEARTSESVFPSLTSETVKWLDDTEITLSHRKVTQVKLSDIYVVPDIEYHELDTDDFNNIQSAKSVLSELGHCLISGEEQQGKTSLLKFYYTELLKNECLPLCIDAENIRKSNLEAVLSKHLSEQYEGVSIEEFLSNDKRVLLIDNIDNISLNERYRDVFLGSVNDSFDDVLITCHTTFSYLYGEVSTLEHYQVADLLGLGHKNREELARKWLSLGQKESISDTELFQQCDEVKARLNIIIKKNIVPSRPIYVLMLLQMFEANTQLNTELTSYGHCYQQLIYQTFENAKIRSEEFEKYLNVLSELAWWILVNEKKPNQYELDMFFSDYCARFLPVDQEVVVNKLLSHSVLQEQEFRTGFKYSYIYYFFAGKKIAESYRDSEVVREKVKHLLSLMHREDYANILIFITHHTKDSWVLSEISKVLSDLFEDQQPASLCKEQLAFMEDFVKSIPNLVLEQREIQSERDLHNAKLDNHERNQPEEELPEPVNILANINKTFKGMEIAGQIIRNRHASLTMDSMVELADTGVMSGLRFLEYFIAISDTAKNEIIKLITSHLLEHPNSSNREIERDAEMAYLHLTYDVINGLLRKIASSVGAKEAMAIYEILEQRAGTPSSTLIRLSIDLQFNKKLNVPNVAACVEKLKDNAVCTRILKEMIVQHTYMFPVEYKEKQQLSQLLDISVKGQRLMDQRSHGKG